MSKKRKPDFPLFNRELSWLAFNRRVLEEAQDPSVPALERLKFLAITSSNLDEFFMVRVGSLQGLRDRGRNPRDPSGLSVRQQLAAVAAGAHRFVVDQYRCLSRDLLPLLERAGLRLTPFERLTARQSEHASRMFRQEILPLLTPQTLDPGEPFPPLPGLVLHLAARHDDGQGRDERLGFVALPRNLPRFIPVPADEGHVAVPVETIVRAHLDELFPGRRILEAPVFRVTRNADLAVREDLASDLLARMEDVLAARRQSDCVRLEIDRRASRALTRRLETELETGRQDLFRITGPLDLSAFMGLAATPGFEEDRYEEWVPAPSPAARPGESIFESIARRDLMLFSPYQAFDPVVRLVSEAADDPGVLTIKQILYRTSRNSPIMAALARAAAQGKQVTALVELKARFDEARNIGWARSLEEAGVQVIYGIRNLKTHAKLCLIVRREAGALRRYMHVGTGNYNEATAALYSDVSYLTCREDLTADCALFLNTITARTQPREYRRISAAPLGLRTRLLDLIAGEAERSRQGQRGWILAKVNSLADPEITRALVHASQAGVQIDLSVRGICCLVPGVPGLSETIRVVSVIDRYLEHARIWIFGHGGEPQVFLSSADWMPRNLDRRIELMTPVPDRAHARRLAEIVHTCMRDNVKGRELQSDGSYLRVQPAQGEKKIRSQFVFHRQAESEARKSRASGRAVFEPHRPADA
jgi:polyphosphate kinase